MEREAEIDRDAKLESLRPEDLFSKLGLNGEGMERARRASDTGDRLGVLSELLNCYREKFALPEISNSVEGKNFETADKVVDHVLQWGPYEEADYGPVMDWEWDPRGDIEWVAAGLDISLHDEQGYTI